MESGFPGYLPNSQFNQVGTAPNIVQQRQPPLAPPQQMINRIPVPGGGGGGGIALGQEQHYMQAPGGRPPVGSYVGGPQQGLGLGGPMHSMGMYPQRSMGDMVSGGGGPGGAGGGGGLQFDAASFPVLSGSSSGNRYPPVGSGGPMRDQQSDFSIQKEDFPALSTVGPPGKELMSGQHMMGGLSSQIVGGSRDLSQDSLGQQQGIGAMGLGIGGQGMPLPLTQAMSSTAGVVGSSRSAAAQQQQQQQQQQSNSASIDLAQNAIAAATAGTNAGSSSRTEAGTSKESRYGLAGLLDVIRMTDRDLNTLALGADLTTFGLNLNSTDCLYSSFVSPFAEQPASSEPQFTTPPCYMMPPPTLKTEHLTKLAMETLFYMFYSMPRDILQAFSAQELYRRDWRYHGELRLWLKPRTPQELMQSAPNVQFVFFDVNEWQARLFTTAYRGNIAAGLLSEEEIRVKPTQTIPA